MINLNFKRGSSIDKLQGLSKNPGTFYIVSDLDDMYVDISDDIRIQICDTDAIFLDLEGSIEITLSGEQSQREFILGYGKLNLDILT
jgi:hypothetical protein